MMPACALCIVLGQAYPDSQFVCRSCLPFWMSLSVQVGSESMHHARGSTLFFKKKREAQLFEKKTVGAVASFKRKDTRKKRFQKKGEGTMKKLKTVH